MKTQWHFALPGITYAHWITEEEFYTERQAIKYIQDWFGTNRLPKNMEIWREGDCR